MVEVTLAPGCFASPIIYQKNTIECSTCTFQNRCAPQSEQRLADLRLKFGIVTKKQSLARPEKVAVDGSISLDLPKKVGELLERFERLGISVTDNLAKGLNPFQSSPQFMRVTCHLLLRVKHGISKADLCHAFITKMNWSKTTATAHSIQAFQALNALGATYEIDDRLFIKKQDQ